MLALRTLVSEISQTGKQNKQSLPPTKIPQISDKLPKSPSKSLSQPVLAEMSSTVGTAKLVEPSVRTSFFGPKDAVSAGKIPIQSTPQTIVSKAAISVSRLQSNLSKRSAGNRLSEDSLTKTLPLASTTPETESTCRGSTVVSHSSKTTLFSVPAQASAGEQSSQPRDSSTPEYVDHQARIRELEATVARLSRLVETERKGKVKNVVNKLSEYFRKKAQKARRPTRTASHSAEYTGINLRDERLLKRFIDPFTQQVDRTFEEVVGAYTTFTEVFY
jgi:hypothetical protein